MTDFHPIAMIFPLIEGDDYAALVDDIRQHGLYEPIVRYDGLVLDGRNRFRACLDAGVEPRFIDYAGDDPLGFVISLNLKRRHLNESQRAMVATKVATLRDGQRADLVEGVPIGTASGMLNVGERSVKRAREVVEHGVPELRAAVEQGRASVSAAAEVASLPDDEQTEIVAKGAEEIVKVANRIKATKKKARKEKRRQTIEALAPTIAPASERFELINNSCDDILNGDSNFVDWVITDPPYPQEHLHLYDKLAEVSEHALKPGGSLLCMVGQSYLPNILWKLEKPGLEYRWTLAYLTPGGQAVQIFPRHINTFWKPVLWFMKPGDMADQPSWIGDVSRSAPNDNDKRFHEWGQSESGMRDLMARFVKPGDVVLDPFMGAGTTGVIALELGAFFVGYDSDKDAYNEALVRIGRAELVA